MKLFGAAAVSVPAVTGELDEAGFAGRPFFAFCDGDDCVALVADEGETADDLVKQVRRVVPEFSA